MYRDEDVVVLQKKEMSTKSQLPEEKNSLLSKECIEEEVKVKACLNRKDVVIKRCVD